MDKKAELYAAAALACTIAGTLQAVATELYECACFLVDGEALAGEIQGTLDELQGTISGFQNEAQELG